MREKISSNVLFINIGTVHTKDNILEINSKWYLSAILFLKVFFGPVVSSRHPLLLLFPNRQLLFLCFWSLKNLKQGTSRTGTDIFQGLSSQGFLKLLMLVLLGDQPLNLFHNKSWHNLFSARHILF